MITKFTRRFLGVFFLLSFSFCPAFSAGAEDVCTVHYWVVSDCACIPFSDTQHEVVTYYSCSNCGETKEKREKAAHSWGSLDDCTYKSISKNI